jgi:hypothetical protein
MMREGGKATIISHSAVFGRKENPVRWFRVGPIKPYAQFDASVDIDHLEPRKRKQRYTLRAKPDNMTFYTIEVNGETVYDSRDDVPVDMAEWEATAQRFGKQGAGGIIHHG